MGEIQYAKNGSTFEIFLNFENVLNFEHGLNNR
jgi:hypothetical protein